MKHLGLLFCSFVFAAACSSPSHRTGPAEQHGDAIGEPIVVKQSIVLSVIGARPSSGESLLIEGTARDVCTRKGCWMQLEDGGKSALVRWKSGCSGAYAFPADVIGKRVLVQGTVGRAEFSTEEVEHMLEEAQQGLDPRQSSFEIAASAVLVLRRSD